jgi:hypothetical protein
MYRACSPCEKNNSRQVLVFERNTDGRAELELQLMLGTYPEISLECAKSRHQYARNLLAQGINPCDMKATLGKNAFVRRMAEWQIAQNPPAATTADRNL